MSQSIETKFAGISHYQDAAKKVEKGDEITIIKEANGALLYKSTHGELGYCPKNMKEKVEPLLEGDYTAQISKIVPWTQNGKEQISLRIMISSV